MNLDWYINRIWIGMNFTDIFITDAIFIKDIVFINNAIFVNDTMFMNDTIGRKKIEIAK
jgi:hypothetical protein